VKRNLFALIEIVEEEGGVGACLQVDSEGVEACCRLLSPDFDDHRELVQAASGDDAKADGLQGEELEACVVRKIFNEEDANAPAL